MSEAKSIRGGWVQLLDGWSWEYFVTVTRLGDYEWDSQRWARITKAVFIGAFMQSNGYHTRPDAAWHKKRVRRWFTRHCYGAVVVERERDKRDHAHVVISGIGSRLMPGAAVTRMFYNCFRSGGGVDGVGWCRIEAVRGSVVGYVTKSAPLEYATKTAQRDLDVTLFGAAARWYKGRRGLYRALARSVVEAQRVLKPTQDDLWRSWGRADEPVDHSA